MRQSGRHSMNRRGFLRASALLGMGAGGILSARPSNAWAAEGSDIAAPTGPFGVRPLLGGTYRTRSLGELHPYNSVNVSPGIIQSAHPAGPGVTAQPPVAALDGAPLLANRNLRFRNSYGSFVWICIGFPDAAACGGSSGGHVTQGWWGIGLNQEVQVLTTQSQWVYFMAEADDGAGWGGDSLYACIPKDGSGFSHCTENCLFGDRRIGMRSQFINTATFTINLVG